MPDNLSISPEKKVHDHEHGGDDHDHSHDHGKDDGWGSQWQLLTALIILLSLLVGEYAFNIKLHGIPLL